MSHAKVGQTDSHEGFEAYQLWPAIVGLGTVFAALGIIIILRGASLIPGIGIFAIFIVAVGGWAFHETRRYRLKPPVQKHVWPDLSHGDIKFVTYIFLLSEALFFGGAFATYYFIRLTSPIWPPIGAPELEITIPALNTIVLLISSVTMHSATIAIKRGSQTGLRIGLLVTVILGILFLTGQATEYLRFGVSLQEVFRGTFFLLTGLHGLHVLIGVSFMIVVFSRSVAGHFTKERHGAVEAAAIYWHFVDVVWLLVFSSLFLV
ncbi:MAG: heme-copper oxidase subunit III [Thaumarchaeota archaeon]|nr:heme-copper oxidase subunit III [Nitrososphaerota archaeon]MCZ6616449.1 heme-copper oxidase subunit III [Nitrososphaerota archaeon]MCZ6725064.1 heme-copper oxidase subunit III [Nitrososphaerota archaeon]